MIYLLKMVILHRGYLKKEHPLPTKANMIVIFHIPQLLGIVNLKHILEDLGVSQNRGTPTSSIYRLGFWGDPHDELDAPHILNTSNLRDVEFKPM